MTKLCKSYNIRFTYNISCGKKIKSCKCGIILDMNKMVNDRQHFGRMSDFISRESSGCNQKRNVKDGKMQETEISRGTTSKNEGAHAHICDLGHRH